MTIYTRCKSIEEFLGRLSADGRSMRDLTLVDLDDAIARKGIRDGCTRASIRRYVYTLRGFLRFAERRQWCPAGLAAGILVPRVYAREKVPAGPTWDQVRRLCADAQGDAPAQIRDRALLLLFAVYGLRGAFPISRSRAHTHRRHGHPLQTVPSAGLIERPQEKNRVDALR